MSVAGPLLFTAGRWNVQSRRVSLGLTQTNRLAYSIDGGDLQRVPSNLYADPQRTVAMVGLFHDVIAENLAAEITPSSFTPILVSRALTRQPEGVEPPNLSVALFGRKGQNEGEILDAKWAVIDEASGISTSLPAMENDVARACLVNVLSHGQTVRLYDDVEITVTLDAVRRVQAIALGALRRNSLYDPTVQLDERNWAITLLSVPPGSHSEVSVSGYILTACESGHAVIACEGVRDGSPFLEYAHLTNTGVERRAQARPEMITGWIDRGLRSRTWSRPRASMEPMIDRIREAIAANQRIPFLVGGRITGALPSVAAIAVFAIASISSILRGEDAHAQLELKNMAEEALDWTRWMFGCLDCIGWAKIQLPIAGIHLECPAHLVAPNQVVAYLNDHPEAVRLTERAANDEGPAAYPGAEDGQAPM